MLKIKGLSLFPVRQTNIHYIRILLIISVMGGISEAQTTVDRFDKTAVNLRTSVSEENDLILAMQEIPEDRPGCYQRVKLLQTKFKYPFIREEEFVEETPTGRKIHKENRMVADHVVVRLKEGTDAEQFATR